MTINGGRPRGYWEYVVIAVYSDNRLRLLVWGRDYHWYVI